MNLITCTIPFIQVGKHGLKRPEIYTNSSNKIIQIRKTYQIFDKFFYFTYVHYVLKSV